MHESYHPKLEEAITVLLAALKFDNKAMAQVQENGRSLLHNVFEALLTGVRTGTMSPGRSVASPSGTMANLDPNILGKT